MREIREREINETGYKIKRRERKQREERKERKRDGAKK